MKSNVPKLVDHVAFRVPMLVLTIAENFHELFEYSSLTTIALLRESRRIMIVTVHAALMLIVAIPSSEDCRAYGACEMLDVVLPLQGCNV